MVMGELIFFQMIIVIYYEKSFKVKYVGSLGSILWIVRGWFQRRSILGNQFNLKRVDRTFKDNVGWIQIVLISEVKL